MVFNWEKRLAAWVKGDGNGGPGYVRRERWASVLLMAVLFGAMALILFLADSLWTGIAINLGIS